MKHLSLQQAMLGMRIVQTDHGMIIKSPAGSAKYDLKGRRIKVSGYPEYFPGQLRVKDKRTKTRGRVEISGEGLTAYGEDGSVRVRMGRINPPEEQELVDEAYKCTKFGQDKEKPGLGGLLDMQNSISDQLDHLKGAWDQALGRSSKGKVPVVMLGGRYTAIGGGYTPEEISAAVEHIQVIRSGKEFSKVAQAVPPFTTEDEKVYIKEAFIQPGIVSINTANFIRNYPGQSDPRLMSGPAYDEAAKAAWRIKGHTDEAGVVHVAGMGVAVEDDQQQVEFKADRFAIIGAALSTIKSALHTAEVKTRLSDDMREAVIEAVRESDLFKALQASQNAQASALVTTQQVMEQIATDAIRNALKPGGLLFKS